MYADPKPLPSVLSNEDPDARRELQALADLRREDRELGAYEAGAVEFLPISRCKEDGDWEYMRLHEDAGLYDLEGRVF